MKKTENTFIRLRMLIVGVVFFMAFAVIGSRAIYVQTVRSPWLAQKASNQYAKSFKSEGYRGKIFDRNGKELAVTIEVTSIAAHPRQIKNLNAAAKELASALNLNKRKLQRLLKSKKTFVWIKRQSTPKETETVRNLKIAGVQFVSEQNRFYPNTSLAAQAIGFTGLDGNGLEGIEFSYDRFLKGGNSRQQIFKDALGGKFNAGDDKIADNRGKNLVLTIDQSIQFITETALAESVNKYAARSGIAIVMDPRSGAVLAMAHAPFFNPNSYRDYKKELWRNRAITDAFEPGSTMKIFSAATAIDSAKIRPNDIFFCENGAYRIGRNVVHDIKQHGWLSLQQIIKFSSNIGAVKLSEKIGSEKMYNTLRGFGFGQKTGIEYPGETTGSLSHHSRWSHIDTGAIAFGHGISVSSIQLIAAMSAIANDGVLMKPYVVQSIVDPNGNPVQSFKPHKVRNVISPQTARIVRKIMQTVVAEGGTGVNAALDGYTVGGKTGTARKIEDGTYSKKKHVASFIGFTPVADPVLSILVIIDEPRKKYHGGTVAAPVFKKIAQATLNYLNIPPGKEMNRLRVSRDNGTNG